MYSVQVSNFSMGVMGVVGYNTDKEISNVWFTSSWQETTPHSCKWVWLNLPRAGRVSSVSVGRSHIAMTMDDHNGVQLPILN